MQTFSSCTISKSNVFSFPLSLNILNLIYLKIKLVTMNIKITTFLDSLPFNNEQLIK